MFSRVQSAQYNMINNTTQQLQKPVYSWSELDPKELSKFS